LNTSWRLAIIGFTSRGFMGSIIFTSAPAAKIFSPPQITTAPTSSRPVASAAASPRSLVSWSSMAFMGGRSSRMVPTPSWASTRLCKDSSVALGLAGKKAIVTGASKGLGRAIAAELAGEGADLAICARHGEELETAATELRASGRAVHARVTDVTVPDQIKDFVARSAEALGGIDILVNNAGGARPGTFDTLTDEDWKIDLDVKVFSMVRFSREVLPHMRARGAGRIININAVLGRSPDPALFVTSVK